jgi:hypothetical protein
MTRPAPQDFNDLTRLLALKRHEQAPPGYFEEFARQVTARIEAGEQMDLEPWWWSLWRAFQVKPVLASAYCLLAAGVCLFALSMVELTTGSSDEEASLAAGVWPQLNPRAAAELTHGVTLDRFSNPLNPLFLEGVGGGQNSGPPRFLLEGTGWKAQPVSVRY